MVKILFFRNLTSAQLWALSSINCLVLKFPVKYLSTNESTIFIGMRVQNKRAFTFFTNFIKIMTPFHKKHRRYRKNDPAEKFGYFAVY